MKKSNITELEKQIRAYVIENGEKEETVGSYRFWLGGLNGVCDYDGHTDILSVLVDIDGNVLVQVNTPDDMSTLFENLDSLPDEVVKKILDQVKA